jgi:hypothetical protein
MKRILHIIYPIEAIEILIFKYFNYLLKNEYNEWRRFSSLWKESDLDVTLESSLNSFDKSFLNQTVNYNNEILFFKNSNPYSEMDQWIKSKMVRNKLRKNNSFGINNSWSKSPEKLSIDEKYTSKNNNSNSSFDEGFKYTTELERKKWESESFTLETYLWFIEISHYKCFLQTKNCKSLLLPFYISLKESITLNTMIFENEIFDYYEDSYIQYIVMSCKNSSKSLDNPQIECHFLLPIQDDQKLATFMDMIFDDKGKLQIPLEKKMGTVTLPITKIEWSSDKFWKDMENHYQRSYDDFSFILNKETAHIKQISFKNKLEINQIQLGNSFNFFKKIDEIDKNLQGFIMNINKPFLFILYEKNTSIILYLGQIYFPIINS